MTTNRVFKVEDGEDVILTDFGNLVTQHHFYLIEAVNSHDTVWLSTTRDLQNPFLGYLMKFNLKKATSSRSEIKFRI